MKYEIRVPYSELVFGFERYIVRASSEDEARKIMESPSFYQYFDDAEQTGSDNYMAEFSDMTIEDIK